MGSLAARAAAAAAVLLLAGTVMLAFAPPPASADTATEVTDFVDNTSNWSRIQAFLNASSTYGTSDAAIAAGTDGAFIEHYFLDVRTAESIIPTSFVEGDAAFTAAFPEIGIPINATGATVVATGLVVTGLGSTLFEKFLGDWDSASGGHLAIGRWELMHRNPGSYTYPYPSGSKLIPQADGDYVWCWQANDTPNRNSCGNLTEWATSPDSGENQAYLAATMMHRGTLYGPYDLSYPYALSTHTYFREASPADLRGALTATTALRPESSGDCTGMTCVTYSGTPMNVAADSSTAGDTRTRILATPEGAQALVHIIITDNHQPGDPDIPAPGYVNVPDCYGMTVADCESLVESAGGTVSFDVTTASTPDPNVADGLVVGTSPPVRPLATCTTVTISTNPANDNPQSCTSSTDNPHWSDGGQTVLAKGWLTCNYTGTAYGTMYMWRCDSYASIATVAIDPGCERVAATLDKAVAVTAGVTSLIPIYVPDENGPAVPQSVGYWLASTTGSGVVTSYSQEGWGYSDTSGWGSLP